MERYPRTCRGASGPHVIHGPEAERPSGGCRLCKQDTDRQYTMTTKGLLRAWRHDRKETAHALR